MKNVEQKKADETESIEAGNKTVEQNEIPKLKSAFFITPLGGDASDIRRATDGLIDAVIEPVLRKHNIILVPPHKIKNPGNITRQIVRHILDSDLVIANLTGLNANVMYELAIRHAKRKPVIVIAEKGTVLPFDIAAERTIFYQNDMGGAVELMSRLDESIPVALMEDNPENPVYSGLDSLIIHETLKKENDPVQSYVVEKLEQLSEAISSLRNNSSILTSTQFEKRSRYQLLINFEEGLDMFKLQTISAVLRSYSSINIHSIISAPMVDTIGPKSITIDYTKNDSSDELAYIHRELTSLGFYGISSIRKLHSE
jgi:nucleoside 2-deoxyribosyltransferase